MSVILRMPSWNSVSQKFSTRRDSIMMAYHILQLYTFVRSCPNLNIQSSYCPNDWKRQKWDEIWFNYWQKGYFSRKLNFWGCVYLNISQIFIFLKSFIQDTFIFRYLGLYFGPWISHWVRFDKTISWWLAIFDGIALLRGLWLATDLYGV